MLLYMYLCAYTENTHVRIPSFGGQSPPVGDPDILLTYTHSNTHPYKSTYTYTYIRTYIPWLHIHTCVRTCVGLGVISTCQ